MRNRPLLFVLSLAMVAAIALLASVWQRPVPVLPYRAVPGWPQLPAGFTFGKVTGVAVDSADHLYVAHTGSHPIVVFDADGKFLRSWGEADIKQVHGLRLDSQGNIWVTDLVRHQVMKFDPSGKLLLALGRAEQPGSTPEQFHEPTDIAFAPSGAVYISDGYVNTRVVKYSKEGKYLKEWGRPGTAAGEFHTPHAIATDAQGRVYVADRDNGRIQIFDSEGGFIDQWRLGWPFGLSLNRDGRWLLADGMKNHVAVIDPRGRPLGLWGTTGTGPGQFIMAHSVCDDSRGAVYVGDADGKRVQKFVRE